MSDRQSTGRFVVATCLLVVVGIWLGPQVMDRAATFIHSPRRVGPWPDLRRRLAPLLARPSAIAPKPTSYLPPILLPKSGSAFAV